MMARIQKKDLVDFKKLKQSWYLEYCIEAFVTGSRVICSPPVTDTDLDVMLLVDEAVVSKFEEALKKDGFRLGGSGGGFGNGNRPLEAWPSYDDLKNKTSNIFHSWKKSDLNLLVTASEEYFNSFFDATTLAISLNLKHKRDRVTLFEAVTADKWPHYNVVLK